MAAAVLAWAVVLRCRNRPGRHLPRYWAIFLAMGTSALALFGFLGGDLARSPLVHACALASLAASFTLLPRLLPLQPDQRLVQHIAPLALAFALFVALPVSCSIGGQAVEEQKQRVGETVAEFSREAGEVREISAFPWDHGAERRDGALRQMLRLQNLPLEQWVPDHYLWQGAAVLGEEQQLAAAYRELLDAVVAGIDPDRTPKLWQSQFTGSSTGWSRDPAFPDLSTAVAGYHLRTDQIFRRLAPPPGESPVLRDLAVYYDQARQEVDNRLNVLAKTWNEDWVPPLIAGHESNSRPTPSPLSELLRRPLPPDDSLRPASLGRLLGLRLWQAEKMSDPKRGCVGKPYSEEGVQYFRLDCYAYAARLAPEPPGADLRVEMRIVYKSEVLGTLDRSDLPAELYFLFPVPAGTDPAKYRDDVMNAIQTAVRSEYQGIHLTSEDRTGSTGFSCQTGPRGSLVKVTPKSRIQDLSGGLFGIEVYARTAATGRSKSVAWR